MKRRYNLYMSEEVVDAARPQLKKMGFSLSSFYEWYLKQLVDVAEGQPVGDKPASEMTLQEMIDVMQYWVKAADNA